MAPQRLQVEHLETTDTMLDLTWTLRDRNLTPGSEVAIFLYLNLFIIYFIFITFLPFHYSR